jgi:hypothetical protein
MKKSNWVIVAILVIASIIFLGMWYFLGFNVVDNPLDLIVSVVWWLLIIIVCVLINWSENKRRRALRTSFLAQGLIYNPEAGIVKLDAVQTRTAALQDILAGLDYSFENQDIKNEERISFAYIVRSNKFENNGASWEGEVIDITNPNETLTFKDREALAAIIDAA